VHSRFTPLIGRLQHFTARWRQQIALLTAVLALSPYAVAHDIGVSAAIARVLPEELLVRFDFALDEVNAAIGASLDQPHPTPEEQQQLGDFIAHTVEIHINGKTVPAVAATFNINEDDRVVYIAFRFPLPPRSESLEAFIPIMSRLAPNHHQYWDIFNEASEQCTEIELTPGHSVLNLSFAELRTKCAAAHSQVITSSERAQAWSYIEAGARHFFIGYDHLLVLIVLLLGSVTTWSRIVTLLSYTTAHATGLVLMNVGVPPLPVAAGSSLAAIAVIYLAVRALFDRPTHARWAYGLAIGLVQSLAFSATDNDLLALAETSAKAQFILCFSLGLLVAQAAFALSALPLAWRLQRLSSERAWHVPVTSLLIVVLAACWLITSFMR
jgi:hypothetical protein